MPVSVQTRSPLYADLIPEGIHEAQLVEVQAFTNAFGDRIGLVFEITTGSHQGLRLMDSAAPKPQGKLADLLRGLGGTDARSLIGCACKIAVRHETNKTGKTYAGITHTFR